MTANNSKDDCSLRLDQGLQDFMRRCRVVAFDLDGTLLNSIAQIEACFVQTFAQERLPVPSTEQIHSIIGLSLHEGIRRLLPDPEDRELMTQVTARYLARFKQDPELSRPVLFSGVGELLSELKAHGYKLALASGKYYADVQLVLQSFPDMAALLDTVVTSDRTACKPDPLMMHRIAQGCGCEATEILGVGDTLLDIEMYRNAHSGELGVLSGVCTWEQLQSIKAQFILPKATALRAYLP